jgi:transcriptional regulator with XRE-family HTH domain
MNSRSHPSPVRRTPSREAPASDARDFEELGTRLRHARKVRKLRLKDVARFVNCSESLLSKIECNKLAPSLHMLHRIAAVLDTTVAALFSPAAEAGMAVFRDGERPAVVLDGRDNEGLRLERLIPYTQGRILNANIHVIPPGASIGGDLKHDGEEVGFVLEGELELTVRGETRLLGIGASFFFRSDLPHSYRNPGRKVARVIWVNSPPF